jgi:hypothetical protein
VVLATALFFSEQAWERLEGSLSYIELQHIKTRWQEEASVPRDMELNRAFALGYRASVYEMDNSDYRYMLASLHAWRERGLRLWPRQETAENKKIIESLKAALVRRPSWFEAWILLALVKYQSGEVDHELKIALEKSIETGACETTVHHGLSYVALRVWDRLGPQLQKSVVDTLNIGLDNPRINKFVVEQIVMTGRIGLFRHKLESRKDLTRFMNQYLEERSKSL